MRLALFSLALTLAGQMLGSAQEPTHHDRDALLSERGPSVLLAAPCDSPCFATMRFDKTLRATTAAP